MVLLLDAYHLGDPLFATALARDLGARRRGAILVHGSAEAGERALEASGAWPEAADGVWRVSTEAEAVTVERATRELNRRLVHELNEAGVPVVGLVASARGLLRRAADGTLDAGKTAWATTLMQQGGVLVVASMLESEAGGALREVDAAQAAAALALALGESVTLLTTTRADGLPGADGQPADALPLGAALASRRLPDERLVERLAALGAPLRAVALPALRGGPDASPIPGGTWIGDARPARAGASAAD